MHTNEIIDEVSLGIYQQDIVIQSVSVFGKPFRSRSSIYTLDNCAAIDIIDSSLTRLEIAALEE